MSNKPRRPKRLPVPELSDEAAYMMQYFLEHFYLWFSRTYATQIRRYREPWYNGPAAAAPHHRRAILKRNGGFIAPVSPRGSNII
jgi:hypothetical protein